MLNRFYNNTRYVFIALFLIIGLISLYAAFSLDGLPEYNTLLLNTIFAITTVLWVLVLVTALISYYLRVVLHKIKTTDKETAYLDLTSQNLTPPESLKATIREFEALGLKPFAVLDVSEKLDGTYLLWYWANAAGTIRAYVTKPARRIVTAFISVLEDDAMIETAYRVRVQMDSESLHVRNVMSSIPAAYHYHQHQLAKYAEKHGQAIAIKSSAELVAHSNRLRKMHHPTMYENRLQNTLKMLMFYGLLAVGFSTSLLIRHNVNILFSTGIFSMIVVLYMLIFDIEHSKNPFGSVEGRKKKKNS